VALQKKREKKNQTQAKSSRPLAQLAKKKKDIKNNLGIEF